MPSEAKEFCPDRMPSWPGILAFWSALVCGIAVFWSISAHSDGARTYNASVANTAVYCATFLLPAVLLGGLAARPRKGQLIACLVATLLFVVSAVLSPDEIVSMSRLRVYYSLVVFGIVLLAVLRSSQPSVVLQVLLVFAMIHGFFLIVALKAALAADQSSPVTPPFFSNVRHFGYHGFLGASAAVSLVVLDQRFRATGFVLAFLALFGIVLFGSRGALVAWAVFFLALASLVPKRGQLILVGMLALVLAILAVYAVDKYDLFNTESLFDRTLSRRGISIFSTHDRLAIWRDAWAAIAARPVLGYGPDGYLVSGCCFWGVVHPHNAILQWLLEFGFAGLISLTWVGYSVFGARVRTSLALARRQTLDPESATTLAIMIGFLSFAMIDGLFYHAIPLLHFVIVAALFLGAPRQLERTAAIAQTEKIGSVRGA